MLFLQKRNHSFFPFPSQLLFAFLHLIFLPVFGQGSGKMPHVAFGKLERIENFSSAFVSSRNIDIWLPPGYNNQKKYPVVYFQDGQMLFDSSITFNRQSWFLDRVLGPEMEKKNLQAMIVVGIWNSGNERYGDYFPQKPFAMLPDSMKNKIAELGGKFAHRILKNGKPNSDAYLKFLVSELKPLIDKKYATRKEAEYTGIAGSSMGGLISMYALCEYPEVFGSAFCLSTHWPGIFTNVGNCIPLYFQQYMKEKLPAPGKHFLYFDRGDKTLDSLYAPHQRKADSILIAKGYRPQQDFISLDFPGAEHSEKAWNRRVLIPFRYRFGPKNPPKNQD
jgi:predicted alpha/beta superfamily hydrolase